MENEKVIFNYYKYLVLIGIIFACTFIVGNNTAKADTLYNSIPNTMYAAQNGCGVNPYSDYGSGNGVTEYTPTSTYFLTELDFVIDSGYPTSVMGGGMSIYSGSSSGTLIATNTSSYTEGTDQIYVFSGAPLTAGTNYYFVYQGEGSCGIAWNGDGHSAIPTINIYGNESGTYVPTYITLTNPNPSSTIYTDFSNWGFTTTGLTTGDSYIYQILYDNAPLSGSDCTINNGELNYLGENNGGGYFDSNSFIASSSTQDLTLPKSGALVDSNATHYTNGINYTSGYPSTLYTEVCLEQTGVGYIQDTTSSIDMALGATPINASSTIITIVSPSSTSTPVAPFENYIYGVTGVATDTQYTTNQTVTQFINGVPITPVTQTQIISGANIIAKGLTFQNLNELDNYGNASSVPMAVGVTISNSIGEIGQLEYNYTMLPFQSVGSNASTGLEQIINPNGTSTLINNIATGNGTASTTIPYSNTGLSSVCSSPSNILDFGTDADYVGCKINNLINQLTFNATQNITDAINGTYNTFTGIFPIDLFADFNNDISIAQAYSNSTSSTPLVLKGQSIADAITGAPTGQYTFGGYTMPILSATTTSWIQTKSGFDYRSVIDNILYALTGLIMLGGAIGVVVMIHKTTAGNA